MGNEGAKAAALGNARVSLFLFMCCFRVLGVCLFFLVLYLVGEKLYL